MYCEKDLKKELTEISDKLEHLRNLKYGDQLEYMKLGSRLCSLIDIQEKVLESYRESVLATLIAIREDDTNKI
jgi:hypothetical protein